MKLMPLAVAAIAAAMSLAACGHSAGTSSAAAAKPTCHQQYETWGHSPAAVKLKTALKGVQSAGAAQDILKLKSSLEAVGAAASAMQSDPVPRCADPKGYYALILSRLVAAGDNARSASGFTGVLLAVAPLKTLSGIRSKVTAELNQTVGKKH